MVGYITLPGFDDVEFLSVHEGNPLRFCIIEASLSKLNLKKKLLLRRFWLRDQMMRLYPELVNYHQVRSSSWYSGTVYFSKTMKYRSGSSDLSIVMSSLPEGQIEQLKKHDIGRLTDYVLDAERRSAVLQLMNSADIESLQNIVFSKETDNGVGTFRGKFMELLFMNLLDYTVKKVSGEGSNSIFLKSPFYMSGGGYGTEIDAVLYFYKPSQLKLVLDCLQEKNENIRVWYNERIR